MWHLRAARKKETTDWGDYALCSLVKVRTSVARTKTREDKLQDIATLW